MGLPVANASDNELGQIAGYRLPPCATTRGDSFLLPSQGWYEGSNPSGERQQPLDVFKPCCSDLLGYRFRFESFVAAVESSFQDVTPLPV